MQITFEHFGLESVPADVTFVDEAEIRELNKTHRNMDKPTDVLSFPLGESTFLGDIVICLPIAKQQSEQFGHSLEREIAFLTLHGLLHLLDYTHDQMEALYKPILTKAGYPR